jgi:NAD(P)-dependent dehydrogenase (short-subunit alcohol dehydrogenase family)
MRFVLTSVDAPLHPRLQPQPRFAGAALVAGHSPEAHALVARLRELGCRVHTTPPEFAEAPGRWLDRLSPAEPLPHLFLVTPCDPEAAADDARHQTGVRLRDGLLTPFELCRRWYARTADLGLLDRSTLVVASRLGGGFGCHGSVAAPEGGGLAGLAKAVFMESAANNNLGPQVKAVDLPIGVSPQDAVQWIVQEFALAQARVASGRLEEFMLRHAEIEVGFAEGRRQVPRVMWQPVADWLRPDLSPGHWIVTGGARGITACVAKAIGTRYPVDLHLLGRSPLPAADYTSLNEADLARLKHEVMKRAYAENRKPNEAWHVLARGIEAQRNLHAMQTAGASVTYHTCDVADREQLAEVVSAIRRQGAVRGVIHGAGVEVTGRFEKKQEHAVLATLSAKVLGTLALFDVTRSDPLEYFIAFGSLSGRFGGVAQTDYVMANEMLAKLVDWYRAQRSDCRSLTLHWPGWSDVGMAARQDSRARLAQIGHHFLDPDEGVRLLLHELAIGAPASEVIIVHPDEVPEILRTGTAEQSPPPHADD